MSDGKKKKRMKDISLDELKARTVGFEEVRAEREKKENEQRISNLREAQETYFAMARL